VLGDAGLMRVDDVASNGLGRYCSPPHWVPFGSRDEASMRVSMTWRPTYARPYCWVSRKMLANSKGDENRVFNCEYNPYDGRLVTGGGFHSSTFRLDMSRFCH